MKATKPANETRFDTHVLSERGSSHAENEDAGVAWCGDDGTLALIVSDGMGGHAAGREASSLVVRSCLRMIRERDLRAPWAEVLARAIEAAHAMVREAATREPELDTMGATVVIAIVEPGDAPNLWVAHVGDSRVYLARGHSLYRLTGDHSLVSRLVEDGLLDEEDAFGHPDSNVLERAVGQSIDLEVDVQTPTALDAGDLVIVCSDGLHAAIDDFSMAKIVAEVGRAEEACRELYAAAIEAGGVDDVTIGCIRVSATFPTERITRIVV